jgi:ATP-dependent helicase/nuclease subunit A
MEVDNIGVNPAANIVIQASAGTGKTSLLVDRIIRLLLEGQPPASILAITFTRKAAAEIDLRVTRRLFGFSAAAEDALARALTALGLDPHPALRERARGLYEALLAAEHGLRAMTFHAFCADILRRFPLEAGVPPNFDLLEDSAEYEAAAWRALMQEITHDARGPLAQAMDELFIACDGQDNARNVLRDFLNHRSDWWAFTEASMTPSRAVEYALMRLQELLGIAPHADPLERFVSDVNLINEIRRYGSYLRRIDSDGHQRTADTIEKLLEVPTPAAPADRFKTLYNVFITTKGTVRILKDSKDLRAGLGNDADTLLSLHADLAQRLLAFSDEQLRYHTYRQSRAWYVCGQRMLDHYQRLKSEHGLLDFADLEWTAYKLLSHSRHAEWVQYKLDQRIDHLLVDEFQDTNPTQWRLLLPLLQEMAAGLGETRGVEHPLLEGVGRYPSATGNAEHRGARSVFVVGDEKQSIYRFRRAEPQLLRAANDWLSRHMHAHTVQQQRSWRSSPAIIRFVNLVFDHEASGPPLLPGFRPHDTHLGELWGAAEVLPLIPRSSTPDTPGHGMRDPLMQPRSLNEDERYQREGELIAATIRSLLGTPIGRDHDLRPLGYGDIILLLRTRAPALAYEQALRGAAIPYIGAGRGNLLDCLEIQDLMQLLRCLISPYDNHALAWALRSPVFDCSDADLMALAADAGAASWFKRLLHVVAAGQARAALTRAASLLQSWSASADKVPVHDLLDRMYNEGNILARYAAATPLHLRARAEANLAHFLELALDIDSGRYPSLARFLARLQALRATIDEAAPETAAAGVGRVRILTIHAAKGLEAPVVFLADAARAPKLESGARALIQWPAEAERPRYFHLIGKKALQDSASRTLIAAEQLASTREDANLLYVALTRAQQLLYVSGCEPGRDERGWYGHIERQLTRATGKIDGLSLERRPMPGGDAVNIVGRLAHGTPPMLPAVGAAAAPSAPPAIDPALTRPLAPVAARRWVYPSQPMEDETTVMAGTALLDAPRALTRGNAIHRMLERLPETADRSALATNLRREFSASLTPAEFEAYWREACAVVEHDAFRAWFDPRRYQRARNELPVLYRLGDQYVSGVIDRTVFTDDRIMLIDYKTHSGAQPGNVAQLAAPAGQQLRWYAEAVRRLWPGKALSGYVLFTACREAVEVTL